MWAWFPKCPMSILLPNQSKKVVTLSSQTIEIRNRPQIKAKCLEKKNERILISHSRLIGIISFSRCSMQQFGKSIDIKIYQEPFLK